MRKGQRMSYRRAALDAGEVERRVREIEEFAEREGRMPVRARHGEGEARLRSRFDYLIRPGNRLVDEGQRARLETVREVYTSKAGSVDPDEEARFALSYARANGEMPHQSDADPRVRRCAFALLDRPDRLGRVSAPLRDELEECRKSCGVYSYRDTEELALDYESFIDSEGRVPDQKGPSLRERRLCHALRRRKGRMTDDQLRRVYAAREAVRPRGRVSFSEKILAAGLRSLVREEDFIGCNVRFSGREADIAVRRPDRSLLCVQYDGAIHRGAESARRDRSADELMTGMGMAVLRVREPGCEPYAPVPGASAVELPAPLLCLDKEGLLSALAEVADAAGLGFDDSLIDWQVVRSEAARTSRAETACAEDVAEYIFRSLTEAPGAASPEMRKLKARLRARCERRMVDEPPLLVLALVEAGLDPTIFASRFFATRLEELGTRGRGGEPAALPLEAERGEARRGAARRSIAPAAAEAVAHWVYSALVGDGAGSGGVGDALDGGEVPPAVARALTEIESALGTAGGDPIFSHGVDE